MRFQPTKKRHVDMTVYPHIAALQASDVRLVHQLEDTSEVRRKEHHPDDLESIDMCR